MRGEGDFSSLIFKEAIMAEKKEKTTIENNDKVTVLIPEVPGVKEQLPVYVSVNGRTALIQRGVPVEIHFSLAEAIKEADQMRSAADKFYAQVSG
jgi:tripartite-type tricarboxylate transporter receptor subunit TctC